MNCENCEATGNTVYPTYPPKVRCEITGELHFFGEKCNLPELFHQARAERDAAVRDLEAVMKRTGTRVCKEFCINEDCAYPRGVCDPKWRGPQQEET